MKYLSCKNSLGVISPDKPIESIEITREPFCYPTDPMHEVRTALTVYTDKRLDSDFFYALFTWAQRMKLLEGYGSAAPTKVIFNGPATIVFWSDGTKTVAKCGEDDTFDPLFGIMACVIRKLGRNRVKVNSWGWVIEFLADNMMDPDECRFVSDVLQVVADAWELDGVKESMEPYDCSDDGSADDDGDGDE